MYLIRGKYNKYLSQIRGKWGKFCRKSGATRMNFVTNQGQQGVLQVEIAFDYKRQIKLFYPFYRL